jgi:hypothetical protein
MHPFLIVLDDFEKKGGYYKSIDMGGFGDFSLLFLVSSVEEKNVTRLGIEGPSYVRCPTLKYGMERSYLETYVQGMSKGL